MDQKPNNKRKVLWLSVGAAALVALIVTTILILFGKGGILAGRNNKGELDVVVADLYWNVDREANTDPNTGLSTREPDSNGLYRVRFSYNGKQIEKSVKGKELINTVDALDVMALIEDENGVVTGVKLASDVASVLVEHMYIQEITQTHIVVNSSLAMNGKQVTLKVTDLLHTYTMSGEGEFVGQEVTLKDLQMLDTVTIYGALETNGTDPIATHVFVTRRWESGKVYWRVDQKYDSKTKASTREPDENGVYTIPFYCDGETVELKFKDKVLVDLVDYTSTTSCYFGFEFDEEGYAVKTLGANKATHTVLQCDRYDIVELNEDGSYVAADLLGTIGRTVEGVIGEGCAIYDISPVAKSEGAMNRKLDSLHLNDRVYIWTDTLGKPVLVYVTARRADSPAYYNPDPQYDTEAKETKRIPNADGYYEIELLEAGKTELQTFYVKDVSLVNTIDKAADLFVGLKIDENNVIEYVYGASSVFGNSYFCRGYVVNEATSAVVIVKSSSGKTTKNGILGTNCKVWDVSGTGTLGEETTLQVGDKIYAMQTASGEIVNIYITRRAQSKNEKPGDK